MSRRPIGRFLRLPLTPGRIRAEIAEEFDFDIDMRARDLVAAGLTPDEARARAEREFGDLNTTRTYCEELDMQREAEERRASLIEDLRGDLIIAWRAMRRSPAFAAVIILTLALGLGANTAVYSVVRRVLIEPLPFRAPDQLYRLYTVPAQSDGDMDKLSAAELDMLARESKTLAGVTEFGWVGSGTYTDERAAEVWQTVQVAPNFFDVLGTRLALGRSFNAADVETGAPKVVIISYERWQSSFDGDTHILDRSIEINGAPYHVVGVLPATFLGPTFVADYVCPLPLDAVLRNPRMNLSNVYRGIARVRSGVTFAQLQSELDVLRTRFQARYPQTSKSRNAGVIIPRPLHAAMVGEAAPVLLIVMVGVVIVLVVTCVNIAGLFLSRAAASRRELGVRAALGAGRSRLVRQVVTESAMYGVIGGTLGIVLAFVLKRAFVAVVGDLLPKMSDITVNAPVLVLALVVSVACGIAFGILPALVVTRIDVRDALGDGAARASSQGPSGVRGSRVLVSAQIACALVLVVGAGLLARTFVSLVRTDLGYQATDKQLAFGLNPSFTRYPDAASRTALVDALAARIRTLPGVSAVGVTVYPPWAGGWGAAQMHIEGRPIDDDQPSIELASASPEYFAAMGMSLRAGRVFRSTDQETSVPVVIVSDAIAKRFWPDASPIGARVRIGTDTPGDSERVREIVGVVGDTREDVVSPITPTIYLPATQLGRFSGSFVVRTTTDAASLIPHVKQILHAIDPRMPLFYPRTVREWLARSVVRQQLAMGLMAAFAFLALLLAALGLYGIVAYTVVARTREFGIRSALGASRRSILVLVLRHGISTALTGIVVGLILAAALSRFMASLLVGVSMHDRLTFIAAPLLLMLVAMVAALLPARAATRVQPVDALRAE